MFGTDTLPVEVTNSSPHGFWIPLENGSAEREELFLPFTDFPWFRAATTEQLCTVERPSADHLYWPRNDRCGRTIVGTIRRNTEQQAGPDFGDHAEIDQPDFTAKGIGHCQPLRCQD
jgi:hypothetical protein